MNRVEWFVQAMCWSDKISEQMKYLGDKVEATKIIIYQYITFIIIILFSVCVCERESN